MKILTKCEKIARKLIHLPKGRCKHFSFLVKKNRIISMGYNQSYKTHPLAKYHRFSSIHSEIHCLASSRKIDGFMVNVRIDLFGQIRNSKPCPACQAVLDKYNIKCFYSTEDGYAS